MKDLKRKALVGLAWSFLERFSLQAIGFVVSVILARALLPEQFGLIGMLTVFLAIGNSLIDSGLTSSLIRTERPSNVDYSTVFYINLVGSVLVYGIIYVSAPWIAQFYDQPELTAITRIYCLSFVIRAFTNVQNTRLTKQMEFRTQMTVQTVAIVLGGGVGIWMAFNSYGVWSLVGMHLVQSTSASVHLWLISNWTPNLVFDRIKFREHFNFGYKLTLSGMLNTIYQNLYVLIIGKFFNAAEVGYFNRANTLRQLPLRNISSALDKVTYPVFASIQQEDERLKRLYRRLMQQVLFWLSPLLVWMAVLADPLFVLLFTEKWLPAAEYFQILCVSGIFYPLAAYNLNILKVKGRSDLVLRLEIIKKTYTTLLIFAVIPFGIKGLLIFQAVTTVAGFMVNTYYSGRLIGYGLYEQMRDFIPVILLSVAMGAVVTFEVQWMNTFTKSPSDILQLVVTGCTGLPLYLLTGWILRMSPIRDFKSLIFNRV
ncbi:MAG TPA: lipopolysaccharide biosynthesis protein [Cyclobacteriaceae bacterium]|jgi:O-antigen/teichoic acid export membrane protein|nr:lipopolysaccharide biosynthesis protein [Cyclobacteriaceae bacterium]